MQLRYLRSHPSGSGSRDPNRTVTATVATRNFQHALDAPNAFPMRPQSESPCPNHIYWVSNSYFMIHHNKSTIYPEPLVAATTEVPSTNRVRKMRFAFWNMPSFRLTTMNCEPLNLVLKRRPMFWVCDKSSAASTSSRMYMGAGLNCSKAMMRERAINELSYVSRRQI